MKAVLRRDAGLAAGSRQGHALLAAYADQIGDRCPLLLPTEAAAMENRRGTTVRDFLFIWHQIALPGLT